MPPMNRREALQATTLAIGGVFLASNGLLLGCERGAGRTVTGMLSGEQEDLVEAMADTLLPTTPASPGAKAAGAGAAINLLVTDCYTEEAQQRLVRGLTAIADESRRRGGSFAELPRDVREQILRAYDADARVLAKEPHWYPLFRELALRAYFSSEIGLTKALRFTLVPGKWVGCVPLAPGQPAWG